MIRATEQIELTIAQTADVTAVEASWGHYCNGDDPTDLPRRIVADGSAKRCTGDTRNSGLGRDLATLRALRGLCKQIEETLPPDTEKRRLPDIVVTVTADTSAFDRALESMLADMAPQHPAPSSFGYDAEANSLFLSKADKRALLGWLGSCGDTTLAEMIQSVRGYVTTDGAQ